MTKPNYEQAKKIAEQLVVHQGYIVVQQLGSGNNAFILPYEDGVKYMQTLKSAELAENYAWGERRIRSMDADDVKYTHMSRKEYIRIKTAELMGIKYNDLPDDEPFN